uniref:uncharacterized protein LOC120347431 n=1 Tax=Styela clava TaxID=7725 RepID=UPI001939AE7B|nr:uncharacterized protein LOC120347431 [Styela clava]
MIFTPMPRLGPESDEKDSIVIEDTQEEKIAYYFAVPLAAVAFIVILAVLLCMSRQRDQVHERRRQTIDIQEGVRDNDNWETRVLPPNQVQDNRPGTAAIPPVTHKLLNSSQVPKTVSSSPGYTNVTFESSETPGTSNTGHVTTPPRLHHNKVRPVGQALPIMIATPQTMARNANQGYPSANRMNNLSMSKGRSKSDVDSKNLHRIEPRQNPDRSFSIANSLDVSPAFRRLKYNTLGSRRYAGQDGVHRKVPPSHLYPKPAGTEEVQLSNYKTLKTDFNYEIVEKPPADSSIHHSVTSRYNTLEVTPRAIRASQRRREDEQEWARNNFLTTEKQKSKHRHKFSTLRRPKLSILSVSETLGDSRSVEDSSLYASNLSLNSIVRKRSSRTLTPSPYKLQVKNSIRPNRKIEYKDGFRRKKTSILVGRSHRRKLNRQSTELELDIIESPSSYLGFETPLPPPPSAFIEDGITSGNSKAKTLARPNHYDAPRVPVTNVSETNAFANENAFKVAEQMSTESENDYEEIEATVPTTDATLNKSNGGRPAIKPSHHQPEDRKKQKKSRSETLRIVLALTLSQRRRRSDATGSSLFNEIENKKNVLIGRIVDGYLIPIEPAQDPVYVEFSSYDANLSGNGPTLIKTERLKHTGKRVKRRMNSQTINNFFSKKFNSRKRQNLKNYGNKNHNQLGNQTKVRQSSTNAVKRAVEEDGSKIKGNKQSHQNEQKAWAFPDKKKVIYVPKHKKKREGKKNKNKELKKTIKLVGIDNMDENSYWTIPQLQSEL